MENPFIVTGKIKPEYFCDRVEESQRLTRCIMSGGENMVIISPRRLGKTGLINFCFEKPEVKDTVTTIFIDILRTTSLQEFTYLLGRAVFKTLGTHSQQMMKNIIDTLRSLRGSIGYDPIQGTPTFDIKLGDITNPTYTLEEIFACLEQAEQRCVVAIDEFQQIVNYPEKNVEALLRTHIQQSANANFIFAGSERHIMGEMFLDHARPFYQSASMMSLAPIALDKYSAFIQHHFSASHLTVNPEAINTVYQQFQGNTYYIQKTFRDAFSASLEGGKSCDISLVERIISDMMTESGHKYSETLARLTLPQKELLYAIADEGNAQRITSSQFIKHHRLQSASSVQAAMRKLIEYGLVTTESGSYHIEDQLFYHWLLNN
ncbi:MAG: ATP-binding protein [Muribaculaceae bacterium]|nr:ATP-binding protein [Muribaculaceae bacterium]